MKYCVYDIHAFEILWYLHYRTINNIIVMRKEVWTFLVTVIPYELRPFNTVFGEVFVIECTIGKDMLIELKRIYYW